MTDLDIFIAIFIFITGACIGSFLNVVALRGLIEESIVFPPSHCPKCNKKLNWYTNIPIISYIFLKGKCQFCKEHISLQYPVVEFLNALLWVFCFFAFGLSLKALFMCLLISMLLVISITDIKERAVLDIHTYIIMGLGLIYNLCVFSPASLIKSLIGIAGAFVIFELLAKLGFLFGCRRAFGEGDTLIGMGIGSFFGWKTIPFIIPVGGCLLAFVMIPILMYKVIKEKNYTTAFAYFSIFIAIITTKLLQKFNVYENFNLAVTVLVALCIMLIWALFTIFADIKKQRELENDEECENESSVCIMPPFGPGLALATVILIFFQGQISSYLNYLTSVFLG